MPVLHKRQSEDEEGSDWFIRMRNKEGWSPPVCTYQLYEAGQELLLNQELRHESEFSKDLFFALAELDLLYKKGDGRDPSELVDENEQSLEEITGLSDTQKRDFVLDLLNRYDTAKLCESGPVYDLLLSMDALSYVDREPVLWNLLEGTPFLPSTVHDAEEVLDEIGSEPVGRGEGWSEMLLGLFIHFVYQGYSETTCYQLVDYGSSERLWKGDDYAYFVGNELIWHAGKNEAAAALPKRVIDDVCTRGRPNVRDFLDTEFAALSTMQTVRTLQEEKVYLGDIVDHGLQNLGLECMIVPKGNTFMEDIVAAETDLPSEMQAE